VTVALRLVVAASIGFAGCSAAAPQPRPATQLTPCTIDRAPAARCGGLEVFEKGLRGSSDGGRPPHASARGASEAVAQSTIRNSHGGISG